MLPDFHLQLPSQRERAASILSLVMSACVQREETDEEEKLESANSMIFVSNLNYLVSHLFHAIKVSTAFLRSAKSERVKKKVFTVSYVKFFRLPFLRKRSRIKCSIHCML